MKVYTVGVEINIMADSPQDAWEEVAFMLNGGRNIVSIDGMHEPHSAEEDISDE